MRSEFSENVITLMTGTTIAMSPILTRIFTPKEFGLLARYASIVAIFSSIASGKYDSAIIIPKDNIDAKSLMFLAIALSLISNILICLVMVFFSNGLASLLRNEDIRLWLYLTPLNIFVISTALISILCVIWKQNYFRIS